MAKKSPGRSPGRAGDCVLALAGVEAELIARGRTGAELAECSAPQLVLLAELHERVRARDLMDLLSAIGAGTCGGEPAKKFWRHLESRLQAGETDSAEPLQPKCNTPLSAEEFAKMMTENETADGHR